jgi:hypothetical protein
MAAVSQGRFNLTGGERPEAVPGAQVKQYRVEQVAVCFLALQVHVRISAWRL